MVMEKFVDEIHPFIHPHHFEPKPFATIMFSRKANRPCQRLFPSQVLWQHFLFRSFPFIYKFICHEGCIKDLSFSTKDVCYPVIMEGKTLLICSNSTLAMILYSMTYGAKVGNSWASSFIESKPMYVLFRLLLITPLWKKSWNTLMIPALKVF